VRRAFGPPRAFMAIGIGIYGWRYDGWRGIFYPAGLPQRQELAYASRIFPSVEINGTFYSLQTAGVFRAVVSRNAARFVFAVKGSRYITHMLKLRNVEAPLANFLRSGLFQSTREAVTSTTMPRCKRRSMRQIRRTSSGFGLRVYRGCTLRATASLRTPNLA
jgi:uncharacterized protein YecE (DUF72 family)